MTYAVELSNFTRVIYLSHNSFRLNNRINYLWISFNFKTGLDSNSSIVYFYKELKAESILDNYSINSYSFIVLSWSSILLHTSHSNSNFERGLS